MTCHQNCCQGARSHTIYNEPMLLPQRSSHWHLCWSQKRQGHACTGPEISQESSLSSQQVFCPFRRSVSGAPRVRYSCGLEELHSPVPGLARACTLWTGPEESVLCKPYCRAFLQLYLHQGCDMSCLHMSESPLHWLCPSESSWPARQQCKLCRVLHESLPVLNQIQEIWFSIWEDYIIIIN